MKKALAVTTMSAIALAGCSQERPSDSSSGAKPVTTITPTSTVTSTSSTTTVTIPESPAATPPDSMPRETDFNHSDVSYVAESAVRSQRVEKAAQNYLARPGISDHGREVAQRLSAQHSAQLLSAKEMLASWGVSNPETVLPQSAAGIPSQADVDQLTSLQGPELDQRFFGILRANLDGNADSARTLLGEGFNPEVKQTAQLLIDALDQERANLG